MKLSKSSPAPRYRRCLNFLIRKMAKLIDMSKLHQFTGRSPAQEWNRHYARRVNTTGTYNFPMGLAFVRLVDGDAFSPGTRARSQQPQWLIRRHCAPSRAA